MSLLNSLQLQAIDDSTDDFSAAGSGQDDIVLGDQLDEGSLEKFWDQVVDDIHKDPDWFTFDDK